MKNRKVTFLGVLVACVLALCAFVVAACDITFYARELEGITLNLDHVKTQFYTDEAFSAEGLVVIAKYDDGSTAVLEGGYNVSGPSEAEMQVVGEKTVTVTYGPVRTYYQIFVQDHSMTSIRIDASAVKTSYIAGDVLDTTGLKVYGVFENEDDKLLALEQCRVNANGLDEEGKLTTASNLVTVNYLDYAPQTYAIEVAALEVTDLEITVYPNRAYNVGEAFKADGLEVRVTYNSGKVEDLSTGFDVDSSKVDPLNAGEYEVTVSFGGKEAEFTVTYADVLSEITVNAEAVRTDLYVGETFDAEDLVVNAVYNKGVAGGEKTVELKEYDISAVSTEKAATVTVTVTYETKTAEFTVNVYDKLTKIEIGGTKKYTVGDEFEGVTVTAFYNESAEGTELDEEAYTLTVSPELDENKFTEATTYTVMVTYTETKAETIEQTATFEITVAAPEETVEDEIKITASSELVTFGGSAQKEAHEHGTDGYIIGGITPGATITYTIHSSFEGEVEIILAAAGRLDWESGGIVHNAFSVCVNGNEEKIVSIDVGTNDYTNFTEIFVCYADLVKGENTIVFTAGENTNNNVNVDYLLIAQKSAYTGTAHKYGASLAAYEECELEDGVGWDGHFFGGIKEGATITYTINSSVAEIVELRLSVAGGSGSNDWGSGWGAPQVDAFEVFFANGSLGKFTVGPTEWTGFSEISVGYVSLEKGVNTIVIKSVNASFNFNYLKIVPVEAYNGTEMIIGAGKAATSGCSYEEANGIIGGIGAESSFTFTFFSDIEANVTLYAAAAGGVRDDSWSIVGEAKDAYEIFVNDESVGKISVGTGDWTNFTEILIGTVMLQAGQNTIEFRVSGGNTNFSYLKLSPAN